MSFSWRKDRRGKSYPSFTVYDPILKKNRRLKKREVPSGITTDDQARDFLKSKLASIEGARLRIQRKLEWKSKYHDFTKLLEEFKASLKSRGDRTWENTAYYLEQYAFPFFLNEKQSNAIPDWPHYYDEFREWLLNTKKARKSKTENLSYSTRNHIISALNTFASVMFQKRRILEPLEKCRKFPTSLLNTRDLNDVLTSNEIQDVFNQLSSFSDVSAQFFWVLNHTGLRVSEGLGLSVADLYEGEANEPTLQIALKRNGIKSLGYLSITSQVDDPNSYFNADGTVRRAPLKGKKQISTENGRLVPIWDEKTFSILADRHDEQLKSNYSSSYSDKLLFPGLTLRRFCADLLRAYRNLNNKYRLKSPHCFRHTFSTHLAGETGGDFYLCKLILGHRDLETTQRYLHIYQAVFRVTSSKVGNKKQPIKRK